MRQIKFRAWDADGETYAYSDKESDLYCWGFENGELKCWAIVEKQDDPMEPPYPAGEEIEPIEQFTGLKDKAGVEFDWWEGDLFELFSDYHLYEIVYDKGCFWFKSIKTTHRIQIAETADWGDIPKKVGNIHSNPGLIDEPK